MAVTAKFVADFSSFHDAVQKAETQLKTFESGTASVEKSLGRMGDSFSGRSIVQQATLAAKAIEDIGGATKLTASEQQRANGIIDQAVSKFAALGQQAPPAILALQGQLHALGATSESTTTQVLGLKSALTEAFHDPIAAATSLSSVIGPSGLAGDFTLVAASALGVVGILGAVGEATFALAEKAARVGGNLHDMSEKTGITVPILSRMALGAQVAGTSVEELANAIYKMDIQAADNPKKFAEGMEKLGLNTQEFLALKPDERLMTFADALRNTSDAAVRNAAGAEVMGRQFKEMGPALMKLGEGMEKVASVTPWTEAEAKQAEEFEMNVSALKVQFEQLSVSLGREVLPIVKEFMDEMTQIAPILVTVAEKSSTVFQVMSHLAEGIGYASAAWADFRGQLNDGQPTVDAVQSHFKTFAQTLKDVKLPTMDLNDASKELGDELKKSQAELDKASEASKKYADQVRRIEAEVEFQTVGTGKNWEAQVKLREEVDGRLRSALAAHYELLERIIPATKEWWTQLAQTDGEIQVLASHSIPKATGAVIDLGSGVVHMGDQIEGAMKQATSGIDKVEGALGLMSAALAHSNNQWVSLAQGGIEATRSILKDLAKGDIWSAVITGASFAIRAVAQLWDKIKELFGGPSADEIAARAEFAKLFSSTQDAMDKLAPRFAAANVDGEEARQMIQALFDATHNSAAAVDAAMAAIEARLNNVTTAADRAAAAVNNVGTGGNITAPDYYSSTGGMVPQYFARGGNVLPFQRRGTDTVPAMLTPGEMVLTKSQQAAVFGSGGGDTVVTTHIVLDGQVVATSVERHSNRQYRRKNYVRAA